MAINFTKPVTTDNYSTTLLPNIVAAQIALAQWLDPAVAGAITGPVTGMYRLNVTGGAAERYNGSSWAAQALNGLNYGGGSPSIATLSMNAGAVGAPSLYWGADTTSGFYRIGANNVGYAVSAAKVLDIAAGVFGVTGRVTATTGVAVATGQRMSYDGVGGDGDTYVIESSANVLDFYAGAVNTFRLTGTTATITGIAAITSNSASTGLALTQAGVGQQFSVNATDFSIGNSGNVTIGGSASASISLYNRRNLEGSTTSYGYYNNGAIQPVVTTAAYGIRIGLTAANNLGAPYTIASVYHHAATQGVYDNDATVTTQHGFFAGVGFTGATNNYGFTADLDAPTAGSATARTVLNISSSGTTATVTTTVAHGYTTGQTVTVAMTANATALTSGCVCSILTVGTTDFTLIGAASNTVGLAFTASGAGLGTGTVRMGQQGSGKVITSTGASTFTYTAASATYAAVTVLTGAITVSVRYNFYASGTAHNYLLGPTGIGIVPSSTAALALAASVAGVAPLRIGHGTAPSSPVDGDVWTTTAGIYTRVNGATVGPLSAGLTLAAEVATTSGTSHNFTGIPAGVKQIVVLFVGVSTNGTSNLMVQIGDSGGIEATGYTSQNYGTAFTTGYGLTESNSAGATLMGTLTLTLQNSSTNTWVQSSMGNRSTSITTGGVGYKSLSAALDRIRLTTVNGTDTFDAGAVSIAYQ